MKYLLAVAFCLLFQAATFAQDQPEWKEMQAFHKVMAQTFHPAEEGNMQPIKTRVDELVKAAVAWQRAPLPQGYNEAVSESLDALVTTAKKLRKTVRTEASDEEIFADLDDLHERFHEVQEKCHDGEEHTH
ncbi:hypothetical protein SAMN05421823_101448 [Catalinimonas alkaloidigena]|uniref:Cytochrome b562 n=1 Tax=Catalinimonas alkaloidigena TaxID=1075417 RepID=A0A1G8XQZ2_9BACT|nr:hypothetical protein [Catalinimonas alkaloidigena]SDJ92893.1 hypothetical protein SAMN05421823_101448 [Catalinimonas alkaloidigena]